jgi:hypothetical protein
MRGIKPDSRINITDIGDYAFRNYTALTWVSLPTATTIGNGGWTGGAFHFLGSNYVGRYISLTIEEYTP